jgi:hypothetical protein
MQYLMLTTGTYERLADANANAVKGLAPKINVWNTGASGENGAADTMAARSTTRRACSRLLGWRRCPRLDRKLWTRRRRED